MAASAAWLDHNEGKLGWTLGSHNRAFGAEALGVQVHRSHQHSCHAAVKILPLNRFMHRSAR